jgi:hypothetical protein
MRAIENDGKDVAIYSLLAVGLAGLGYIFWRLSKAEPEKKFVVLPKMPPLYDKTVTSVGPPKRVVSPPKIVIRPPKRVVSPPRIVKVRPPAPGFCPIKSSDYIMFVGDQHGDMLSKEIDKANWLHSSVKPQGVMSFGRPNCKVHELGIEGQPLFDLAKETKPSVVFISLGETDNKINTHPDTLKVNIETIVRKFKEAGSTVYWLAPPNKGNTTDIAKRFASVVSYGGPNYTNWAKHIMRNLGCLEIPYIR